jgi:molybdenum transport protein
MSCLSLAEIDRLIAEDVPYGDLTTRSLAIGAHRGHIHFAARDDMVVCGSEEARAIFDRLGAQAAVLTPSGTSVKSGSALLEAHGSVEALFSGWKVAQTLMEWSSGIATAVAQLAATARQVAPSIGIACTRKTVPFSRRLSVKAVLAGGGVMHRLGLSDTVLLFPEHRLFAAENESLLEQITRLRRAAPERSMVVEVTTVTEALAAAAHADVLQLEKFSLADVARVVDQITRRSDGRPIIAVAGGINAANAAQYAASGANVLVSSWPYQAPPRDVQVRFNVETHRSD